MVKKITCEKCGKEVEKSTWAIKNSGNICRSCLQKESNLKKFGVENIFQLDSIKEKSRQTKLEKYGNENYNNEEKNKQTKLEKYGNPFYNNRDKVKQTCQKKYGVDYNLQDASIRKRIKATCIQKYGGVCCGSDEIKKKAEKTKELLYGNKGYTNREKAKSTMLKRYGVASSFQFESTKEKLKELRKNNDYYVKRAQKSRKKYFSNDGHSFDSKWEVAVWEYCIKNSIPIKRGPILEFQSNNKIHRTMIDFEINNKLYEVKGTHLLEGVFDYQGVPIKDKLECYKNNNIIIITTKNRILDEMDIPWISIDSIKNGEYRF
jgi:hypothetical protein